MTTLPIYLYQNLPERRSKLRMECSFPATVEGFSPDGKRFTETATLENVSAAGLYMRTHRVIPVGEVLHIRFSFAYDLNDAKAPNVSVIGVVLRSEPKPDGTCGLAVKFNRRHLF